MSNDGVNNSRRRFLATSTAAVGAVGVGAVAVPFLGSWMPSAKAKAAGAPVSADLSKIPAGMMMTVEWRGKPVYVVNRTQEQIANLKSLDGILRDPESKTSDQPDYIQGQLRSVEGKDNFGIYVGLCTHLGCAPQFRADVGPADLGADWLGGFFCPCHGSKYDLAGRVYKNVPAPENLIVPPYKYVADAQVIIGEDGGAA